MKTSLVPQIPALDECEKLVMTFEGSNGSGPARYKGSGPPFTIAKFTMIYGTYNIL